MEHAHDVCHRCAALAPCTRRGPLLLCARCPLQEDCGEFPHAYRPLPIPGEAGVGGVCTTCGAVLTRTEWLPGAGEGGRGKEPVLACHRRRGAEEQRSRHAAC